MRRTGVCGAVETLLVDRAVASTHLRPLVEMLPADIELWLDWLKSRGDVDPDKIKPSDVYTNDYNPYAK